MINVSVLCSFQENIMYPHPFMSERLQAHSPLQEQVEQSPFLLSEQQVRNMWCSLFTVACFPLQSLSFVHSRGLNHLVCWGAARHLICESPDVLRRAYTSTHGHSKWWPLNEFPFCFSSSFAVGALVGLYAGAVLRLRRCAVVLIRHSQTRAADETYFTWTTAGAESINLRFSLKI